MKTINTIILLFLIPVTFTSAQVLESNHSLEKLELMKGKWAGSGWVQPGPGPRHTFNQTEHVYTKLGSQLIVIDGEGRDMDTGEVTFQAFGVIKAKTDSTFQFSAYTMEGRHTLANAAMEDQKFIWWFDVGSATIRYEIELTEDTWIEDGYYIPSPEKKYPMFHMELKRQ